MDAINRRPVHRWRGGQWQHADDELIVEEPLEIRVNGRRYTATMRTPQGEANDILLAQGLLFTEGIISELDDIEHIEARTRCRELSDELVNVVDVTLHDESTVPTHLWERSIISNSSCGLCGKASIEALSTRVSPLSPTLPPLERLPALPDVMREQQRLFQRTGGLHAAALFTSEGELVCCFEDIGRHNATDRVVGYGLTHHFIPGQQPLILLVSGRASFEIIQKALVARITTVAAVSAASSLAVELAAQNNLNLIGFLRPQGMTVYTENTGL